MIDVYIATWSRPLGKLYVHNIKYTRTRTLEKYKLYDACYILPLTYILPPPNKIIKQNKKKDTYTHP